MTAVSKTVLHKKMPSFSVFSFLISFQLIHRASTWAPAANCSSPCRKLGQVGNGFEIVLACWTVPWWLLGLLLWDYQGWCAVRLSYEHGQLLWTSCAEAFRTGCGPSCSCCDEAQSSINMNLNRIIGWLAKCSTRGVTNFKRKKRKTLVLSSSLSLLNASVMTLENQHSSQLGCSSGPWRGHLVSGTWSREPARSYRRVIPHLLPSSNFSLRQLFNPNVAVLFLFAKRYQLTAENNKTWKSTCDDLTKVRNWSSHQ